MSQSISVRDLFHPLTALLTFGSSRFALSNMPILLFGDVALLTFVSESLAENQVPEVYGYLPPAGLSRRLSVRLGLHFGVCGANSTI